ncbi:MAG TPA: folylpolyglutamate synthase/dihydrofolate synthase family protein [Chryseosolibacter sp.]
MIPSYQEALRFLYDNLPIFQRVGAAAYKKDLTNTLRLCQVLGDPHKTFKSIHVAGTNGKGSSCHTLASILQAAGYKTGLYTSPHLKEFTERIRINGLDISQQFVLDFVNRIRPAIEEIRPSFFEITVAMAFDYFAKEKVDVAVIEVGLGGRLDSTNVITPLVSLITNISWDHKELLGDTLPKIAAEKAGIIKRGVPVVVSERQSEVEKVFIHKAENEAAPISFASDEYTATIHQEEGMLDVFRNNEPLLKDVKFPLTGSYQQHNIPGVLKTLEILAPHFPVSGGQLRSGLEGVVAYTGLKGRWQKIHDRPTVVCDTGHNYSGIQEVLRQVSLQPYKRLFIVWGMVKDKDVRQILELLPENATYYFCQAKIPRAMEASMLMRLAADHGLKGQAIPDVNDAKRKALSEANTDDFIFVGGSTYVVAELDEL